MEFTSRIFRNFDLGIEWFPRRFTMHLNDSSSIASHLKTPELFDVDRWPSVRVLALLIVVAGSISRGGDHGMRC